MAAQASGLAGSLVGPGLSWRAGPLLPAAGLASALLHRTGAKQGSEGAIGGGAATLHLEVGSQGSILAGAPLGGRQGIWKESRRVAWGALKGTFASGPRPAECALCPARTGLSTLLHAFTHIHSPIHSPTHSFIHSFVLQHVLTRAGLQTPQRLSHHPATRAFQCARERHGSPTL